MNNQGLEKQERQRERVRIQACKIQERLDKLPALLDAENTAQTQVDLFMLRSKLNELYSELTVYIYLLREARQETIKEGARRRLDGENVSMSEFEAAHEKNFAALLPIIEAFANQHGLHLSRSFDPDPHGPHACYFCGWPLDDSRKRFIRICAQDPFEPGTEFYVDAEVNRLFHQRWNYSSTNGSDALRSLLEEAKRVLTEQ